MNLLFYFILLCGEKNYPLVNMLSFFKVMFRMIKLFFTLHFPYIESSIVIIIIIVVVINLPSFERITRVLTGLHQRSYLHVPLRWLLMVFSLSLNLSHSGCLISSVLSSLCASSGLCSHCWLPPAGTSVPLVFVPSLRPE